MPTYKQDHTHHFQLIYVTSHRLYMNVPFCSHINSTQKSFLVGFSFLVILITFLKFTVLIFGQFVIKNFMFTVFSFCQVTKVLSLSLFGHVYRSDLVIFFGHLNDPPSYALQLCCFSWHTAALVL